MKRYVRQMRVLALCIVMLAALATALHAQSYTVKYNFGTNSGDPIHPTYSGIVAQGRDGNLYSTTPFGGANAKGAMFKITPGGKLTVVYSFDSTDPYPYSGLTLGTDGNFYGATYSSGTPGDGTVFKITPRGTVTLLHSFTGSDGSEPFAPPIEGTDGNFYGTTTAGGAFSDGTVYKITPSGTFTSLYSFDGTTGEGPIAPLVQGSDGNFYGTTELGGMYDAGVVFKITPSGTLTAYSLDGGHGGELSFSPLVQGSNGSFYGTASSGGTKDDGAIFKITATGRVTLLHSFNGTTDGAEPFAGLVQATDGNFYGAASNGKDTPQGTIFKISPTSPYPYQVLYSFDGTAGATPWVTLVQHTNGILYGETNSGGTGNMGCAVGTCGVFYSWNAGLGPFVSLVSAAGKVGKTIGILGQGFTGTKGVSFNGTAATFTVVSSTYLTAKVPSGATTGFVTVTTPKGTLTSNKKFRVIP